MRTRPRLRRTIVELAAGIAGAQALAARAAAETAPAGDFHVEATVRANQNNNGASWDSEYVDVEVAPFFRDCTTTEKWKSYDICDSPPHRLLVCEETDCFSPTFPDPLRSEDCWYCDAHPDCCELILEVAYAEQDQCTIALPPSNVAELHLHHWLGALSALEDVGRANSAHYHTQKNQALVFRRPQGVPLNAPATLRLPVTVQNILLSTGDGEATIGFARYELVISSPQLGLIFRSAVRQPKDGLAIVEGTIPAQAFARSPGRVELMGYQHPEMALAIPPGLFAVRVDVQFITEGAADWDRNCNGQPDRADIEAGISPDADANGVPDEVERFNHLHHALGAAIISQGASNELLLDNIGASGQDGVAVLTGALAAAGVAFSPVPAGQLPVGASLSVEAIGSLGGQSGSLLESIRTTATGSQRYLIFADVAPLSAQTALVAVLDDDILRALHQIMIDGAEDAVAESDRLMDRVILGRWPWDGPWPVPVPEPELGTMIMDLGWSQPALIRVSDAEPVLGDRVLIITDNQPGRVDYVERLNFRASGVPAVRVIDEPAYAMVDCPDLDGNGVVDLVDLATVLGNYGTQGGPAEGDLNGDGVIDLPDLTQLLSNFGTICP